MQCRPLRACRTCASSVTSDSVRSFVNSTAECVLTLLLSLLQLYSVCRILYQERTAKFKYGRKPFLFLSRPDISDSTNSHARGETLHAMTMWRGTPGCGDGEGAQPGTCAATWAVSALRSRWTVASARKSMLALETPANCVAVHLHRTGQEKDPDKVRGQGGRAARGRISVLLCAFCIHA